MTGERHRRGLIDTNIVILLPFIAESQLPDDMVISAVTLAELSAGPHHAVDSAERARRIGLLQRVESTFDPVTFDAAAARAFGQISAAVLARGRTTRRRMADLMIASVALAHEFPLYTTNPRDFTGVDSLIEIMAVDRPRTT